MFRGVPRSMNHLKADVANTKAIPVPHELNVILPRVCPVGLPLRWALVREENAQPHAGKLARTRQKVCVDVRFRRGNKTKSLARSELEVTINVDLRIDNDGLPATLTADQIGVLGQSWIRNLS